MNSILLLAALAADPATPAPPETVYVERFVIERQVNPQAAPARIEKSESGAKYVLSALMVGAGAYLIVHGQNNPTRELVFTTRGYEIDESTNPQVWLGSGLIGIGILTLSL